MRVTILLLTLLTLSHAGVVWRAKRQAEPSFSQLLDGLRKVATGDGSRNLVQNLRSMLGQNSNVSQDDLGNLFRNSAFESLLSNAKTLENQMASLKARLDGFSNQLKQIGDILERPESPENIVQLLRGSDIEQTLTSGVANSETFNSVKGNFSKFLETMKSLRGVFSEEGTIEEALNRLLNPPNAPNAPPPVQNSSGLSAMRRLWSTLTGRGPTGTINVNDLEAICTSSDCQKFKKGLEGLKGFFDFFSSSGTEGVSIHSRPQTPPNPPPPNPPKPPPPAMESKVASNVVETVIASDKATESDEYYEMYSGQEG